MGYSNGGTDMVVVGIFDQESEVLEAMRSLREAGAAQEEIRVVVGNREGARILASSPQVNLEELYEIQETRQREEDNNFFVGSAPVAFAFSPGNTTMGNGMPGAIVAGNVFFGDGAGSEKLLKDIGIPAGCTDLCAKAVENGQYLLVADTVSEIDVQSMLAKAGAIHVN
ncbi:general stress protein [Cohnella terricola]|uniref:Uncharacterized protein n=1 Tax=Cohnella terricola TaxID=1289167 RepID=A0A559J6I1_9BACL|nr:general stress protein [Cohnella terricola]TVX95495.1 hypothetical protein FPZ45_23510 [Cohnella terricola]